MNVFYLLLITSFVCFAFGNHRQHSSPRNSIVNLSFFDYLRKTPALGYAPRGPSDIFDLLRYHYPSPEETSGLLDSYDFVIIGGGSAGSVIASRLSESKRWTVLLIEAGGTESFLNDVPIMTPVVIQSRYKWDYTLEKTEGMCKAAIDERCPLFRGRGLGGSSLINYMMYTRGNRKDWDQVAAAGNPEWSFDEVLPYFLKSERANLKGLENSKYHNKKGLLSIEDVPFRTKSSYKFLEAGVELGYKLVDYNEGKSFGFSHLQSHTLAGRRHSVSKAYLYPFRNRPNLHILTNSKVTKINIDPITKTAQSVVYARNKKYYKATARKEIILSAGTLISPQLLMLSGVGPKEHLRSLGIDVVQDLSVGDNMHDHVGFYGLTFLVDDANATFNDGLYNLGNLMRLLKDGSGPFSTSIFEAISYVNTKNNSDPYPDIEIEFAGGGWTTERQGLLRRGLKISDEFYDEIYGEILGKPCFTLIPLVLYSESRGKVRLKDSNPFHWPIFTYKLAQSDVITLKRGIEFGLRLGETEAFKSIGARLYKKHFPGCETFRYASDEYWDCAMKFTTYPNQHHMGTCKMGPGADPSAVVDSRLRVHGIKRLRVGDISVIPMAVSPHTNAPAIMIGEKLADMIKEDWRRGAGELDVRRSQ